MKIYTKTGDKGETGLIGGKRVLKNNQRIIAYGSIDELNSNLGVTISLMRRNAKNIFMDIVNVLTKIQNDLFIIGADLADPSYDVQKTYAGTRDKTPRAETTMTSFLESTIDKFEAALPTITFFLLPGGSLESSSLHVNRTVARRSEIAVVTLSQGENVNPCILTYLNRLSDLLFVIARTVNRRYGISDIAWEGITD
ncbi:MAG: cob(I)yrinic acid a,c-diamide adenosyltransferase [Nitrososphaeraceae archaeon]|jgi:cob(I)alamin adenosyltransferase